MGLYFGFLIFAVCLLVLVYKKEWFFYLTIFFIPFSNTAVINVGANSVSLPFALVVINFIYFFARLLLQQTINYNKHGKWAYSGFFLVFLVVGISALMPLYIDGEFMVLDRYSELLTYADPIPLRPSMQYITQLIYFQVGLWFAYYVTGEVTTMDKWLKMIKTLVASGTFIAAWGLFEFSTHYIGIEYPAFLLSNLGLNQDGINLLRGIPRISSATLEPSIFAQTFAFIIPMMAWLRSEGHVFFSRRKDLFILVMFVVAYILSNSSTAYVLVLFFVVQFFWNRVFNNSRLITRLSFFIIGLIIFIAILPFAIDYAISKLGDWSGRERTLAVVTGVQYFLAYPVLGVGWGVFPVWDVLVCIACGAGIIGLIVFIYFLARIYYKLMWLKKMATRYFTGVSYAALAFLLSNQVAGFIYHSQYVWLFFGVVVSFILVNEKLLREKYGQKPN